MKIAFDENMPAAMVRTFQALAGEKRFQKLLSGCAVVSAKDYTPRPTDKDYIRRSDVPWLTRYAQAGGRVLISGNTNMPYVPQELLALEQMGMIAFFFERTWNEWKFFRKSALLLLYWEKVVEQAKAAKPGSLFKIPNDWREAAELRSLLQPSPLRLEEGPRTVSLKPKPKPGKGKPPSARTEQPTLNLQHRTADMQEE